MEDWKDMIILDYVPFKLCPEDIKCCAIENEYFYAVLSIDGHEGLHKFHISPEKLAGKVEASNGEATGQSMMLLKDRLYIRNEEWKPQPFKVFNKDTLQEIKIEPVPKYEPAKDQI
jgi:hypothetical protein